MAVTFKLWENGKRFSTGGRAKTGHIILTWMAVLVARVLIGFQCTTLSDSEVGLLRIICQMNHITCKDSIMIHQDQYSCEKQTHTSLQCVPQNHSSEFISSKVAGPISTQVSWSASKHYTRKNTSN
jgi:hypothetical protein